MLASTETAIVLNYIKNRSQLAQVSIFIFIFATYLSNHTFKFVYFHWGGRLRGPLPFFIDYAEV